MYEETKSSIDWKGLFLKVIIVFLIVLIGFKSYSTLKGNNKDEIVTTKTDLNSKSSSTFTINTEKLKKAGENYYLKNTDKIPTSEGYSSMITLNELISKGEIERLKDENGKNCNGESSYVSLIKEGDKVKIKTNLVCENDSNFTLVDLENYSKTVEETKTTATNTTNVSYTAASANTGSSTTKTTTCGSSCNTTPSVNVSTSTTVKEEVKYTVKDNTKNDNYSYINNKVVVSFESNGGSTVYASQKINRGERAYNPGSTEKTGYTFTGWYTANGTLYDFNTSVERDITLYARFVENYNYYYQNYNYNNYDDYYYSRSRNNYNDYERTLTTDTNVYTIGWNSYGSQYINISHTLQMPSTLRNSSKVKNIRIKNIEYVNPITSLASINIYKNNHANTYFYTKNGWEYDFPSYWDDVDTLSTISRYAVRFSYDTYYKTYQSAKNEGFDVTWTANSVDKQCRSTFAVNGVSGLCNYGIIYKVTWEYTM